MFQNLASIFCIETTSKNYYQCEKRWIKSLQNTVCGLQDNMKKITLYETFCAIWHQFYNFENVKSTQVEVLLLKAALLPWVLSRFLISTNDTKSPKVSRIWEQILMQGSNLTVKQKADGRI